MSHTQPIRVAIIGLGRIGLESIAVELLAFPESFTIAAVCDLDKSRRDEVLKEAPDCHTYRRIEDAVQDSTIELFILATRTDTHFKDAQIFIKAGKHILVEPPLCITPEELILLRAEAIKSGSKILIRQATRFTHVFTFIQEMVKSSNRLTDIYSIELNEGVFERRDDWLAIRRCAGGALYNEGVNLVDLALTLMPSLPTTFWADVRRVAAVGDAEDTFSIQLRTNSNFLVSLSYSGGRVFPRPYCTISAENGELIVDTPQAKQAKIRWYNTANVKRKRASVRQPELNKDTEMEVIPWQEEILPISDPEDNATHFWNMIYETIRGNQSYPITLEQSLEVLKIITKAKRESLFF